VRFASAYSVSADSLTVGLKLAPLLRKGLNEIYVCAVSKFSAAFVAEVSGHLFSAFDIDHLLLKETKLWEN